MYQQFCDRNLALKKREDELQLSVSELGDNETELRKTISELKQQLLEFQQNKVNNNNLDPEIGLREGIHTNDASVLSNTIIDYHSKEEDVLDYSSQIEPSPRTIIFDTKDLFSKKAQT